MKNDIRKRAVKQRNLTSVKGTTPHKTIHLFFFCRFLCPACCLAIARSAAFAARLTSRGTSGNTVFGAAIPQAANPPLINITIPNPTSILKQPISRTF